MEAIGLLALLIREAPHAVACEREHLPELLETSLVTIPRRGRRADVPAPARRMSEPAPTDLAEGISPEAVDRAITESLRHRFVQSGLLAADALTALSNQLREATGQFQRTAGQLSACTDRAKETRGPPTRSVRKNVVPRGTGATVRESIIKNSGPDPCGGWAKGQNSASPTRTLRQREQ